MAQVHVEGADELLRKLDAFPQEVEKAALKAMREAAKDAAKAQKQVTSGYWPDLVTSSVKKDAFGMPYATVGYRTKSKRNTAAGSEIPDWFKAYWMNYGTLNNRDRHHAFKYKVKNKKRRNNEGQRAVGFFTEGHPAVVRAFDQALEKAFTKHIEKYYNGR